MWKRIILESIRDLFYCSLIGVAVFIVLQLTQEDKMTGEQKAWVYTCICITAIVVAISGVTGGYYAYKQSNSYEKNAKITCEIVEVN